MLKTGDRLPDLSLTGHDGKTYRFEDFKGQPLVVFFYPKNETPGCVAEACSFRDQHEEFVALGAKVVGISGDGIDSHKAFIEKRKLPYLLLSDKGRKAEKAFGVPRNLFGLLPGRVTFVADASGKIVSSHNSSTQPTSHVSAALKALESLKK